MAYKVPTVQDMINAALKKKPSSSSKTNGIAKVDVPKSAVSELRKSQKKSRDKLKSSNDDYPTSGSVWVTRPNGTQTAASARDLQELLAKGYTYEGVRTSGERGTTGYSSRADAESKGRTYKRRDDDDDIDDMYDQQRKSLLAQLRASIAKAKSGYKDIIGKVPQTYQPLRNQTEVSKEQQLASMRESLANQGNAGGTGRQGLLDINTAAGNQMNDINLQQQNVINDANSAIKSLDEQAAFKESEITADMAAQKLQAILAEQARAEELDAEQERYTQEYSDKQKQQEFENKLKQQQYQNNLASQQLEREINSIGAYSNDFIAEIQRRRSTGDTTDDTLIPYLQAASNEKIAQQLAQADNTASQAYKNAYQLWLQLGVANEEIARILGISVGAKTLEKVKTEYSTAKPYYSPNTGSNGGYGLNW